jgi:hypothetical protein
LGRHARLCLLALRLYRKSGPKQASAEESSWTGKNRDGGWSGAFVRIQIGRHEVLDKLCVGYKSRKRAIRIPSGWGIRMAQPELS